MFELNIIWSSWPVYAAATWLVDRIIRYLSRCNGVPIKVDHQCILNHILSEVKLPLSSCFEFYPFTSTFSSSSIFFILLELRNYFHSSLCCTHPQEQTSHISDLLLVRVLKGHGLTFVFNLHCSFKKRTLLIELFRLLMDSVALRLNATRPQIKMMYCRSVNATDLS